MNKRKLIKYLVVASLFVIPSLAWAEGRCEPQDARRIKVDVTQDMGRVFFDHSKSQAQLKRMSGKKVSKAWLVNGLTKRTYTTQSNARFVMRPTGSGGYYCVRLSSVDLTVGLGRIDVYVANKYRKNTCAFQAIMRHEREHVEINRRVLRRVMGRIEDQVRTAVYRFKPFSTRSQAEARDKLSTYFKKALEPLYRKLDNDANLENARIDTEQSYKYLRGQCDQW